MNRRFWTVLAFLVWWLQADPEFRAPTERCRFVTMYDGNVVAFTDDEATYLAIGRPCSPSWEAVVTIGKNHRYRFWWVFLLGKRWL